MRQNIFHLTIQKKANYFSYFFHRGMFSRYSYNPMTTLYFEDKTSDVTSHHTSINNKNVFEHTHSKVVYENTYPQHIYNTSVYTSKHSPSLKGKEKNDFGQADSITANNSYLFHNKIANKFSNFSFAKHIDVIHAKHAITFANTSKNFSSSNHDPFKHQNINPTELIHQKEKTYVETKQIEQLEQRIVSQVEQKLKETLLITKSTHTTHEEHIRIQREEKKDADKIYTLVMQRWDKEQKRKGYLYA